MMKLFYIKNNDMKAVNVVSNTKKPNNCTNTYDFFQFYFAD